MPEDPQTKIRQLRELLAQAREAERKARADHEGSLLHIREIGGELAVAEQLLGSTSASHVQDGTHDDDAETSRIRKRTGRKKAPAVSGFKPPVAELIADALAKAGDAGISGADLNRIVERCYSTDASEKAKSRMRKNRIIVTHRQTQMWYLPEHAPEGCE